MLHIKYFEMFGDKNIFYPYINKINENRIVFACIADGRKFAKVDIDYSKIERIIYLFHNQKVDSKEEFTKEIDTFCDTVSQSLKLQVKKQK